MDSPQVSSTGSKRRADNEPGAGESGKGKRAKRSKSSCKSVNLVLGSSWSSYDLKSLVVAASDADDLFALLRDRVPSLADSSKKSTAVTASTGEASASSSSSAPSSSPSGVKRLLYFGVNETVKAVKSAKCQLLALTNPSSTHLQFALIDVCKEARVPLILVPNLSHLQVPGISRVTVIGVRSNVHDTSGIIDAFTKLVTPYAKKIFTSPRSDDADDDTLEKSPRAPPSQSTLEPSLASTSTSDAAGASFESLVASLKSQAKGQAKTRRRKEKKEK